VNRRGNGLARPTWEDPTLIQLWGPRFNVFVVAARDLAVFSLGTQSDDSKGRRRAEDLAARLHALLDGARMTYGEAGRANPERSAVRGSDRHGRDPMGRRAAADGVDRGSESSSAGRTEPPMDP
jgi:hypothetical protein